MLFPTSSVLFYFTHITTAINIIITIVLLFLTSYVKKKGENLASKQDIAKITDEIEKVKTNYSLLLEEVRAQNQFRLAILPEQLKRYQEASTLLMKLILNRYNLTEFREAIQNCQDWFTENHIYLDTEAQKVFKEAYTAADRHTTNLLTKMPDKETLANYDKILNALKLFQQGLQLPRPTLQKQEETPK